MPYNTRYGEAIQRVLNAYMPGVSIPPTVVAALETVIKTACDHAKAEVRDDFAERVCEGLHEGPAAGLKCMKCYLAEHHFNQEMVVQAEIDSAQDGAAEADPDGEV